MTKKTASRQMVSEMKHAHLLIHARLSHSRILFFSVIALLVSSFAIFANLQSRKFVDRLPEVAGASSYTVSSISTYLNSVYFTFATFRYGRYATPTQLKTGDMLYFKNFDTRKLRLLQVFLYDYEKKGNQEFIKRRVTTQSMYVRTKYLLPANKRYSYVAKFQDKVSGEITTKYFPLYNIPPSVSAIDFTKPWTVATNCPATTLNCVPCTSGSYCRFEPKYKDQHGFLGWACQNNNPGNIRNSSTNMSTDFKNKMIVRNGGTAACGVRYDSRGGSYFIFSSYTVGYEALKAYIKGVSKGEHSSYVGTGWACGNCTLTQFFSKYAPGDSSYATRVATFINEPVTQTLEFVVANKLNLFAGAIQEREGFFIQE